MNRDLKQIADWTTRMTLSSDLLQIDYCRKGHIPWVKWRQISPFLNGHLLDDNQEIKKMKRHGFNLSELYRWLWELRCFAKRCHVYSNFDRHGEILLLANRCFVISGKKYFSYCRRHAHNISFQSKSRKTRKSNILKYSGNRPKNRGFLRIFRTFHITILRKRIKMNGGRNCNLRADWKKSNDSNFPEIVFQ